MEAKRKRKRTAKPDPPELRKRNPRLVREHEAAYAAQGAALRR